MTLLSVVVSIVAIVVVLLTLGLLGIVGLERLRAAVSDGRDRVRSVLPYVLLLGGVLVLNSVIRDIGPDISWEIGIQITGNIYLIEGEFVAWIQSFATPTATSFFSVVYIYGYIFLLCFPFLAYALRDDLTSFRTLTLAYALNYTLGLTCYIVFVAYGPRNLMPELVDSLLYSYWPESQLLTSEVNVNTNVFPSLHASLSTTVAILAVRTRRTYPRWVPVAVPLAAAVCVSTMYLGIHWGVDVLAGFGLAVVSVLGADYLRGVIDVRAPSAEVVWRRLREAGETLWNRVNG